MMGEVGWAVDWTNYMSNVVVCGQAQQMRSNEAFFAYEGYMQDRLSFPISNNPAEVVALASLPPYSFQLLEPI